jgi:hypothetical protein
MRRTALTLSLVATAAVVVVACATTPATGPMSFFVTSTGPGKGADLGGIDGADAHCAKLASTAGASGKTWRAYLSTSAVAASAPAAAVPAVNARDRIGKGPWFNAKGVMIASDVANLHNGNNIIKATTLDERGNAVKGRTETPNQHDVLTGSRTDGNAFSPTPNLTCGNWTSSGEGAAMVGHHDRSGLVPDPWATSWNSSHNSVGCSQDALVRTGGAGLFYCFAAN